MQALFMRRRSGAIGVLATLTIVAALALHAPAWAGGNRLLGTGGVMEVEGSAGGGAVPWALIAGLGTDAQIGGSGFCTQARVQKFDLKSCGVAVGFYDRVELS